MTSKKQDSPLLALPAEIRNQIYQYAFQDGELDLDVQYKYSATPAPGVVFACRQTYHESRDMYYSALSLVSSDAWILRRYLSSISICAQYPINLITRAYLDCRNRSEQERPLESEARYALRQHSSLSLSRVKNETDKLARLEAGFEVRVCIVTPWQEVVWTNKPKLLGEALEGLWGDQSDQQDEYVKWKEILPSGVHGIEWEMR